MKCPPTTVLPPLATVGELADYLGQPVDQVEARCRSAAATLARSWRDASPTKPAAVAAFYQAAQEYLFDLTWWHALGQDDSATIQWRALETAIAHRAHTVLDFGSGIGSLGLLLAAQGFCVSLADINPHLENYARWRFSRRGLQARFLAPSAIPAGAFDFISAVDVVEHLPQPVGVLAMLAAALRPGGVLFVHLPQEPDASHPMHFQHDVGELLRRLREGGLWVERAVDDVFVLRRGVPPRYKLEPGLELAACHSGASAERGGGTLFSLRPLMAMRLNSQAFALLSGLDVERTAEEAAALQPGVSATDAAAFFDSLVARRLLAGKPCVTGRWPPVSVIVPARDRPAATRACIESLLALSYPGGPPEILVVDDASEPPLGPVLADLPVRILRQHRNIGQSAARNLASAEARGDLLAFIDNDCLADPIWLQTLIPYLEDPAVGIVGGRVVSPTPTGWIAAFEAVRSPLDMGVMGGPVGPAERIAYLPTCNLLVRRDVLLAQGGFSADMRLGEDVDFIWRTLRAGVRALYAPSGRIVHYHRVRLGSLLGRRADYGSSEAQLQRLHPEGRRIMRLPRSAMLLLAMLTTLALSWPTSLALGLLALLPIGLEIASKRRRLQQMEVTIPARRIGAAVVREHGASLYHLSANVTRYYGVPLIVAGLLWPPLLLPTAVILLVAPISDYYRLGPSLPLPAFTGLYLLEMAAYQLGVWRGCLRQRSLGPLFPILRWGR